MIYVLACIGSASLGVLALSGILLAAALRAADLGSPLAVAVADAMFPRPVILLATLMYHHTRVSSLVSLVLDNLMEEEVEERRRVSAGNDLGSARLAHAIAEATDCRDAHVDEVCPICLESLHVVHMSLMVAADSRVKVRVRAARGFRCRACGKHTHLVCMLRCLLHASGRKYRCPLCMHED